MKKVPFKQKEVKLLGKKGILKRKKHIMEHVLKMQRITLLPKCIKSVHRVVI
jgi:hypothetical protein